MIIYQLKYRCLWKILCQNLFQKRIVYMTRVFCRLSYVNNKVLWGLNEQNRLHRNIFHSLSDAILNLLAASDKNLWLVQCKTENSVCQINRTLMFPVLWETKFGNSQNCTLSKSLFSKFSIEENRIVNKSLSTKNRVCHKRSKTTEIQLYYKTK